MAQKSNSFFYFDGFEAMQKKLTTVSKEAEKIAERTAKECADIMSAELKASASSAGVPKHLIDEMQVDFEFEKNKKQFKCGWHKGAYTQGAPLSDGYKLVFMNYGAPDRKTAAGANRGTLPALHFMKKAKTKAKNKINKEVEKGFADLNKELEK